MLREKLSSRFLTRSAVQPQKIAKRCEISDLGREGLNYLCSENNDADQHMICAFFLHMQKADFLMTRLIWNRYSKLKTGQ